MEKREYLLMLIELIENVNRFVTTSKVFPTSPEGTADAIIDPYEYDRMVRSCDSILANLCKD